MFFFKKKKKSLLNSQKLQKKSQLKRTLKTKIKFFSFISIILSVTAFFFLRNSSFSQQTPAEKTRASLFKRTPPPQTLQVAIDWQKEVNTKDEQKKEQIRQFFSKNIESSSDLSQFSKKIALDFSLSKVLIKKISPSSYRLTMSPHTPIARVVMSEEGQNHEKKYLNEEGQLFSTSQKDDSYEELKLLNIEGCDNSFFTERELVSDLLELISYTKKIESQSIVFEKYRGFSLLLAKSQTKVVLGRAPFSKNFAKLEGILSQSIKQKGKYPERIEMDYSGKIFVKERAI